MRTMRENAGEEAIYFESDDPASDPGTIYVNFLEDLFSDLSNAFDGQILPNTNLNTHESPLQDAINPGWPSTTSPFDSSSALPTTPVHSGQFVPPLVAPQRSYEVNTSPVLDQFVGWLTLESTVPAIDYLDPILDRSTFSESQINSLLPLERGATIFLRDDSPIDRLSGLEAPIHALTHQTLEYMPDIDAESPFSQIRRKTFDPTQISILSTWLVNHLDYPYPSREEKQEFADKTGLEVQQINTWFCNVRKRHPLLSSHPSPSVSNGSESSFQYDDRGRGSEYSPSSWRDSSCDSVQTAFSASSEGLLYGTSKRGRKRRYSSQVSPVAHSKRSKALSSSAAEEKQHPRFQCTFCRINLSSKSWKRHEEIRHLPQVVWICMATGPVIESTDAVTGQRKRTCGFCLDEVEEACLRPHRIQECLLRPSEQRTFLRKDNLRQHFRNFHPFAKLNDKVAERWKLRPTYSSKLWLCGFCGEAFADWNARAKHIGKHFLEGLTMDSWRDTCPEQSTSAAANVQVDHHVQELVRNGVAFRCPPKDDEIVPHTHCFHRGHSSTSWDSREFSGCESIRLGLSQPLEEPFTQSHIWTCNDGADLILSAKGTSGATYWIRFSIQAISSAPRPSLSGKQSLVQLELDRRPEAFVQASEGDPILARELVWASLNKHFSLLLKFNGSDNLEEFLTFLFARIGDRSYRPMPPNIGDYEELSYYRLPERSTSNEGDAWDSYCVASQDKAYVGNSPAAQDPINDIEAYPDGDLTLSIEETLSCNLAGERSTTHPLPASGPSNHLSEPQLQPTAVSEHCLKPYTCGYPRYRHKSWGCRQKFRGLIGIADHIRSTRGKGCKRNILRLQKYFELSSKAPLAEYGLPQALFEIYPALASINFDNLAKLDDPDGDDEDEALVSGKALSTIFSVSSKSESSRAKSVVRMEDLALESPAAHRRSLD